MDMNDPKISRRRLMQVAFSSAVPLGGMWRGANAQQPQVASRPSARLGRAEQTHTPLVVTLEPLEPGRDRPVVTALASDPQGQWLAVAADDLTIRLFDCDGLVQRRVLPGHRDLIRSLAFRGDSRGLASAGNDGRLILWDRDRDWAIADQIDELPALYRVRFSPDGAQLAAIGFHSQLMMFGAAGQVRVESRCKDPRGLAYDEAGRRLAVVGKGGKLWVLDPRSGESLNEIDLTTSRVRDLAFLPETTCVVVVGEDGTVSVADIETGQQVRRIDLLPCKLFVIAAIDRDRVAVAGSDNRIRIVNCQSGQVVEHLDGHQGSINSLAWAAGVLISGGFDTTVRRWQLTAGQSQRVAEREQGDPPSR
jgi:WD40 repeat protein